MNWIMLRGLGRQKEHWGHFAKLMQDSFDQVIMLDFPGMQTDLEQTPIKIDDITDFLREKFLKQKKEGPFSILAISLGGMVALNWVDRYPDDFKHIITINSSTRTHSKFYERMRPAAIKTILGLMFESNLREREKKVLEITTNQMQISDEVLDRALIIAKSSTMNRKTFMSQLIAASRFRAPYRLKIPYTTIVSEQDRFTSAKCSKDIAKHYKSELIIHPTTGHDLPSDDPQWLLDKVKDISQRY